MAMSSSSNNGSSLGASAMAEINVTPLVDVMLVLLIIFMVTAPMLQTGVDVNLPEAKAQVLPDDSGKLIVTINKDRRVWLGPLEIPWDQMESVLKSNEKIRIEREVYLHADESLLYRDVLKVMAAIKLAGADKLGMITDPLE
jgi:biopolymer transport protein TolR